jgi:hypothetical protein
MDERTKGMSEDTLHELAADVRRHSAAKVAELSGVRPGRVSRFIKAPKSVTMPELERITRAVRQLDAGA